MALNMLLLPFTNYSNNFYTTGKNWEIPGSATVIPPGSTVGITITEAIFRGPYWGANGSTGVQVTIPASTCIGRRRCQIFADSQLCR